MVMEDSISGVLEQSFLYKECCYFVFVLHLVAHPGFVFSSSSSSTRAILDGFNLRSVFSPVCVRSCLFYVLYFSVMLLELNVAIVYYIIK